MYMLRVWYSRLMFATRQEAVDTVTPAIAKLTTLQQTFATGAEYDPERVKKIINEIADDLKASSLA